MVAPAYTSGGPGEKYKLSGSVLIFGAGALVHEQIFFEFDPASTVVAYDPYYSDKVPTKDRVDQPRSLVTNTTFCDNLSAALGKSDYNHVVALFSLHYEPQWISVLCALTKALAPGGALYTAKDQGFRMILDGLCIGGDDLAREVRDILRARHCRGGGGQQGDCGTPWEPSIRASDCRQIEQVLSIIGFNEVKTTAATLTRQPTATTLRDEARQYLPWMDVEQLDLLPQKPLPNSVSETIVVSKFTSQQPRPSATGFLSDSPPDRQIRSLVTRDAASALATLDLALPQPSEEGSRKATVKRLRSYGCAWLSVLYQHMLRHVPYIEAAQLIFQQPSGRHQHIVDDLIDVEFGSADDVIFLNCIRTDPRLHPWNYNPTQRYESYKRTLKAKGFEYLAKPIFSQGITGIYWDGATTTIVDSEPGADLTQEFAKRSVPSPCLYTPARLAYIDGLHANDARPLTLVALIIYFLPDAKLSASEWKALHSSIYPLLDSATSRVALAEMVAGHHNTRLLAEKERAHQVLLRLQRPLDELTRAFESVQSEAQEMLAMLNSPESSLFRAHKFVSDIFVDNKHVPVSKTLTAKPEHSPDRLRGDDLRMLYALVLCSIFGRRGDLLPATTVASVVGHAREILRECERSPVYEDLCSTLRVVIGATKLSVAIWETLDAAGSESSADRDTRQQKTLARLKQILFAPFKDFSSSNWPAIPFFLAIRGDSLDPDHCVARDEKQNVVSADIHVNHDVSPIPQHGALDFLLAAKEEYEHRKIDNRMDDVVIETASKDARDPFTRIAVRYSGATAFFDNSKSDALYSFLFHIVTHGVSGRNYGNFFGCFARLLRNHNAVSTAVDLARPDAWVLEPRVGHSVLMQLVNRGKRRLFRIEDAFSNELSRGVLLLEWNLEGARSCDAQTFIDKRPVDAMGDSVAPASRHHGPAALTVAQCFVSDHRSDGPWASALGRGTVIIGRELKIEVLDATCGADSPKAVTIPSEARVLILHTQDIHAWKQLAGHYAIVRVSTQTGLTDDFPHDPIVPLCRHTHENFSSGASAPARKQGQNALLKAVMDALARLPQGSHEPS